MSMYRVSLPFPRSQRSFYCSFTIISLRISWGGGEQEQGSVFERPTDLAPVRAELLNHLAVVVVIKAKSEQVLGPRVSNRREA